MDERHDRVDAPEETPEAVEEMGRPGSDPADVAPVYDIDWTRGA